MMYFSALDSLKLLYIAPFGVKMTPSNLTQIVLAATVSLFSAKFVKEVLLSL